MRFRKLKKRLNANKEKVRDSRDMVAYAAIVDRIKAFVTDMFMIYVPILYLLAYVIMDGKEDFQSSLWAPLAGVLAYGLIYSFFLYKFGQTPGKKAYEIKVVDAKTRKNVTFAQAMLRFASFLFSATILLGLIVPFYRKDKRSLHDLIANTVVLAC
jgi:uncharacterized RDD family membrane protein YckC